MEKVRQLFNFQRFLAAVLSAVKNKKRTAAVTLVSTLTYFFFTFNTNIAWNSAVLSEGFTGVVKVLSLGTSTMLEAGTLSFSLKLVYSVLIGFTAVNFYLQIRRNNISKGSLSSILPGLFAGGCGCGLGVLSLVGFAGATAFLPFQGNLVMILGLLMMIYALNSMGNPDKCDVNISYS